ncbi:MAG: HD-GYP domain-containing protein [Spirochaetes bacterium]|nr:HD-GYP domain-containing protein [Spirochaetota bacterium]
MKRILVSELQPGMRFTKPVYIDKNNMLAGANVSIKDTDLKRLNKWGIKEVETDGDLILVKGGQHHEHSQEVETILDNYNKLILLKERLVDIHDNACKTVIKTHTAIRNNRIFPTTELEKAADDIFSLIYENQNVFLFLYGIEHHHDAVAVHSVNTTFYAMLIGMNMKYTKAKMKDLALGTLMINSGMVQIPAYIMHKESELTDREYNQIKTHPILGYQVLKKLGNYPETSALVSMQHHEQFDGKGYPRGLKGTEISEYARIASIADNYEALLEKRSYRDKQFFYHAMKQLVSSGSQKFDPVILRIFISILSIYPIGSIVELNKRGIGIVIGSVPNKPMRPIIKLVVDQDGNRFRDLEIVNLLDDNDLYIVRTINEEESGIKISDEL